MLLLASSGRDVACNVTGTPSGGFNIEFTPTEPGPLAVDVEYGNVGVAGSPFTVVAYDISRIRVMGIKDGMVGSTSVFTGLLGFILS